MTPAQYKYNTDRKDLLVALKKNGLVPAGYSTDIPNDTFRAILALLGDRQNGSFYSNPKENNNA